ncbi:hypothetical protein [Candidatus Methylocalor cossyra]
MATIALLGGLVWGTWKHPEALWAPGDLSRYHADIPDCGRCHAPFQGPIAARCIACHTADRFAAGAKPAVSAAHRRWIETGQACFHCHTEHRGALAQITVGALVNPHGEFVFRATGTHSCGACHEFGPERGSGTRLLDNAPVRRLLEQGKGAHGRGRMARCLSCHSDGTAPP